jgi:CRP-like cAMP-binding protein
VARKDVSTLRDEAAKAVERGKWRQAVEAYEELEKRQPADAQWPKRLGEVHRRAGDSAAAIAAFERAVDRYVGAGFLVQAIAVCKLILQIDPKREAIATRLAELAAAGRPVPAARAAPPPVEMPKGAPLDAVALGAIVPGAKRDVLSDGQPSGVMVIPIEEEEILELEPEEHEHSAIDLAIENVEPSLPAIVIAPPPPPRAALDLEARRALLATPLLAGLPPRALEALIARLALVELSAGEVLFVEGEPGACLYIVTEGEIVVEAHGRELARLGAGAFVGEVALVTDLPRSATVRTDAPAELLAIDRDVVRDLIAEHPQVLGVLLRFVRDRLVDRVTHTAELFGSFSEPERKALSARFELVEVDPGTPLIVQGTRADGLYIVLAGRAEVWRDGEPEAVAALGPGEVFGEMSLLGGTGATAHVRAASRVLALRMPARTFQEVIMTHPQVLAYVGELADRRAPRPEAAGDFVDLHLDLL